MSAPTLGSIAGLALHSDIRTAVEVHFSVPPASVDDALALADAVSKLGPVALSILTTTAQRYAGGVVAYMEQEGGNDFPATQDYENHELDELIDARTYRIRARQLARGRR